VSVRDDRLTETVRAAMSFADLLGIEGVATAPGSVTLRGHWSSERCTANGVLHGGYLMTLADCAAATCAYLALPVGAAGTTTIEAKTNFLRAVRAGAVTAEATIVHAGRRTLVVQTDVRDDDGALVSRTLQTQAVLYPETASGPSGHG
jgi:uncharacterized protein (TIGR00369 family)